MCSFSSFPFGIYLIIEILDSKLEFLIVLSEILIMFFSFNLSIVASFLILVIQLPRRRGSAASVLHDTTRITSSSMVAISSSQIRFRVINLASSNYLRRPCDMIQIAFTPVGGTLVHPQTLTNQGKSNSIERESRRIIQI